MKRQCFFRLGFARPTTLFALGGLIMAGAGVAPGATFRNPNSINVTIGGAAALYPSPITVSQVTGTVTRVAVTLNNVFHEFPDDLDVLLVGPTGQKALLMSDAGGRNPVNDINLTFAHGNGVMLPDAGQITNGVYEPTDYSPVDIFPNPAPSGPYGTDLTVFNGVNPNGTWQLFVFDDATANGGGSIGSGWSLELEVAAGPLTLVESPQSQTVDPGKSALFRVIAAGTPPLFYQWQRNGALLPGETNSTLSLINVQAISGGSFSVTVFNQSEALATEPATLLVPAATAPPPTDQFANRPRLQGAIGLMQGDSSRASRESGEPVFPGGGKTVWCEWIAPADGIMTLTAQGSGFDTLLGVFTGTTLSKLALVTMDDDQGGFYTSQLQFNVHGGTSYQIMLDGLGPGGGGDLFTLGWSLEQTREIVPVIVNLPVPQTVLPGSNAVFSVLTQSPTDTFQWFHDGVPIRGATSNSYSINAQAADLGRYVVQVSNSWGRLVQSPPVYLELGLDAFTQGEYQKSQANGNRPGGGLFVSIFLGEIVWKQGAVPPPGPAGPCGTSWAPIAQGLLAEDTGFILVHTGGSTVAARISVYEGFHDFNEVPFDCGPEGNPSFVIFPVVQGSNYVVEIEPVLVGGNITFTNFLGVAPELPEAPEFHLVPLGGSFQLTMPATNWVPLPTCQWRLNGENLPGATNTTLLLTNFNLAQAGAYSVVMSNFVRVATNTVAHLGLAEPLVLGHLLSTNNGNVGLIISASNAAPFLLQTTTNLDSNIFWEPLFTNQVAVPLFIFTNGNLLADPRRFFRAIHWPPAGP